MRLYLNLLAIEMLDTLSMGGIISLVSTWVIILTVGEYTSNQVGIYAVAFLMFWPIGFLIDFVVAFMKWKSE